MDQFTKEGRKLRPRKTSSAKESGFEKVDYSSRNDEGGSFGNSHSGGHRSFGPRHSSPQHHEGRRNYGEHQGERRSYGERSFSGEGRRDFGGSSERRSYGEYQGERRGYGERRSWGEHQGERKSYGEHRSFSKGPYSKRGFGPKRDKHTFGKDTAEGINRMIERRPIVEDIQKAQSFEIPVKNEIRLNKFIANSGVCSRREADTLIMAGVVTVNGEVITELGTKVNVFEDDIRFNGERLRGEEKVYIVMNKPKGFVTTASDPHADKTVIDLVKNCPTRVYPVGRLDKNTTGVLLLTNDGEIAERLTHPSYDKKKIYQVALDRELSQEDYEKVLSGVELSDGVEKADELEYIDANDKRKLGIEIHSGKNRIVRRLFESLGYTVKALDRVYFAGVTKKGLKRGEWRYLSEGESNILKMGAYI